MIASSALQSPGFPDAYDIVVEFGGGNATTASRSLRRRRARCTTERADGRVDGHGMCRPLLYVLYDLPVLSALQAHLLSYKGFATFEGPDGVEQVGVVPHAKDD